MMQPLATVKLQLATTQHLKYMSSYLYSRMLLFSYPSVPNSTQTLAAMFCVLAFTYTEQRRAPGNNREGQRAVKRFF